MTQDGDTCIYMIGAARSGTTWLQLMLGAHPRMALTLEFPFFHNYAYLLQKTWEYEGREVHKLVNPADTTNRGGLPLVWSEERFRTWLRNFILEVHTSIADTKSGATHVLVRDRFNSFITEDIHALLPHAKFIHVIRDGRDASCSLLAAYKDMGFGETNVIDAARNWKACVIASRAASHFGTSLYTEVRYEELLKDTVSTLARVLDFSGLSREDSMVEKIVAEHTFDILKQKHPSQHPDYKKHSQFYRKGRAGAWQEDLTIRQKILFAWTAGDLLLELGYETNPLWYKKDYLAYLFHLPPALLVWFGFYLRDIFSPFSDPRKGVVHNQWVRIRLKK